MKSIHVCGCVSITSILLTGCCQRRAGRAAAIYVVCEIRDDNNGCYCQAGVGQRQDQLACSFWGCQSLSSKSAATPQLPLSVACTLWLHPAEFSQSVSCVLSYVASVFEKVFEQSKGQVCRTQAKKLPHSQQATILFFEILLKLKKNLHIMACYYLAWKSIK